MLWKVYAMRIKTKNKMYALGQLGLLIISLILIIQSLQSFVWLFESFVDGEVFVLGVITVTLMILGFRAFHHSIKFFWKVLR